ncbi:JNK1/MAPK8-associated membrane protein-like [Anabrus simplex]|uniref:JNK1/MAPK8-associated membrane protein-like n=1 Tax=Anabrus simplex TaxID=316456 RepID=UPI0035A2DBE3
MWNRLTLFLYPCVTIAFGGDEPASNYGTLFQCPGLYCGRQLLSNGTWSNCGACPRGFRANASSACVKCIDSPFLYDWLYLGFMALLVLVFHLICIDFTAKRKDFKGSVLLIHICAALEIVTASSATILLSEPIGTLKVHSCHVVKFSDWYTLLYNPTPNYEDILYCTQEAVFPLYTMVFMYLVLCLLLMLLIRPWIANIIFPKHGKMSIYAALYFIPILALIQALFGGLIYYSYPYITIILSVVSNAVHFAYKENQTIQFLITDSITDGRNMMILVGHWLLHAYGIAAVTEFEDPILHLSLLALVPFPAIFYILTVRFTDPIKVHVE